MENLVKLNNIETLKECINKIQAVNVTEIKVVKILDLNM